MNIYWLIGAALFGVAALSVYGAFQSPTFVLGLVGAMLVAGFKAVLPIITKRNTPEVEARMHECTRRGGKWDNFRKRCE